MLPAAWLLCALMGVLSTGPESAGEPAKVGLVPVAVEGHTGRDLRAVVVSHLRDRLGSGVELVSLEGAGDCQTSDCYAEAAGAQRLRAALRVIIRVEARDYTLRTELIDGRTGKVVRADENFCEICTYDETLELLGQQAHNVRQPLSELLAEAPVSRVSIASSPGDAVVRIDGEVVGATPFEGSLPPGEHVLSVEKDGFRSERRTVALAADTSESIVIELERERSRNLVKPIIGWSAVGVGIPLLAAGVTLIVLDERPHKSSCHDDSIDENGTCEFRYNTLTGGIVSLVAGVAAAGAGTTLLVLDRRERGRLEAWFGPGGGGLRGRF